MATLYTPDGRITEVYPANGEYWTLTELHSFVGGYYEIVSTINKRFMVINDQAKLVKPPLPLNVAATRLYVHGREDVILGPALVVETFNELNSLADTSEPLK